MQIVRAIDIEDALRLDLAEHTDALVCAPPAPNDLQPNTVCVTRLGGGEQTAVSHEHDVSIDCWADTAADAMDLANDIQAIVASLPLRTFTSGRHYTTASAILPYLNPDPQRPLLPRYTFTATVGIRGTIIEL